MFQALQYYAGSNVMRFCAKPCINPAKGAQTGFARAADRAMDLFAYG
jgi:hypothetical protein